MTTLVRPFSKLYSANTTANADSAPAPTTTEPTGDGVLDALSLNWNVAGGWGANQLFFQFFGAGADNATLFARFTGWRRLAVAGVSTIWIPIPLLKVDMILGQAVGVAGAAVLNTERFADTITLTAGAGYTGAYELVTNADNRAAGVKLDTFGCEKVSVKLWVGTATNANGVVAPF